MTVSEFLRVCNRIEFMLQDEENEIGYMSREGIEKYFFDRRVKEISFNKDEEQFLIIICG